MCVMSPGSGRTAPSCLTAARSPHLQPPSLCHLCCDNHTHLVTQCPTMPWLSWLHRRGVLQAYCPAQAQEAP